MSKAKTAADTAAANAEQAMADGAEVFKAGFDKALKNCDRILAYGKDTSEAVLKSATAAGKGVETLNTEIYAYSRQALEETVTATKAIMGSKSLHEAFEHQSSFARSAFETYIAGMTQFGALFTAAARESAAPLRGRAEAWFDIVQASRA